MQVRQRIRRPKGPAVIPTCIRWLLQGISILAPNTQKSRAGMELDCLASYLVRVRWSH